MNKIIRSTLVSFLTVAIVAMFLLSSIVLPSVAFAEEQTTEEQMPPEQTTEEQPSEEQPAETVNYNPDIDEFVRTLCNFNATSKSAAKQYIIDTFRVALGEEPEQSGEALSENGASLAATAMTKAVSRVTPLYFSRDQKSYFNIEAKLEGKDTSKQIIIGAHYDAIGEGAGDNVCGVAALYQTLKTLAQHEDELPYSVTFVAFDGEEDGLLGSYDYVNNLADTSSVLVMFNIDSIVWGDNLYLMCENRSTDLADLILKGQDPNLIREKPYARGTSLEFYYSYGYGYYEYVQGSDHTPFRLVGIPIAFFFSGTYPVGSWGFDAGDAINTANDTYENLTNHAYVERIFTVSDVIANTVLREDFVTVAANARNQLVNLDFWYNGWWPRLAVLGILMVLVVFTVLYNRKLQKKAILGTAEIKTQKVFEKPSAEEIFTFKGQTSDSDDSNVDGIFTFKK